MSGKTYPVQASQLNVRSFYGESPPKRKRLLDNDNLRPAPIIDQANLTESDSKISKQFKNSEGDKLDRQSAPPPLPSKCEKPVEIDLALDQANQMSPVPLKNLGNTCYENSIIQCLFSLDRFMDHFMETMQRARKCQAKTTATTQQNDITSSRGLDEEAAATVANQSPEDSPPKSTTDVRYRVARAFERLYKTYLKSQNKQQQTEHQTSSNEKSDSMIVSEDKQQQQENSSQQDMDDPMASGATNQIASPSTSALSLCKSYGSPRHSEVKAVAIIEKQEPSPSESPSTQKEAPIALISSSTAEAPAATNQSDTRNEPSEIETRLEELKSAIGERNAQFNSTHQQDASEFFYHVIDSIQEFYQSLDEFTSDDNPVTKAFELELDHLIRCPKCHNSRMLPSEKHTTLPLPLPHVNTDGSREDCSEETNGAPTPPTSDLGLDSPESSTSEEHKNPAITDLQDLYNSKIKQETLVNETAGVDQQSQAQTINQNPEDQTKRPKQYTLSDALNNYFKDDLLDYTCPQQGCSSKQRTKRCLIRKLPEVLFLSLARYSYTCKKSLEEIQAPFELQVPFKENRSPSHSPSAHRNFTEDDYNYRLVAVVCHLGSSLNAGHYTSYVYNQKNQSWYWCDDDSITQVQESDVAKEASKNGYCFFYSRKPNIDNSAHSAKYQVSENTCPQTTENHGTIRSGSVLDSTVVMTPEYSPTSSPTPPAEMLEVTNLHADHSSCVNNLTDIDDWS